MGWLAGFEGINHQFSLVLPTDVRPFSVAPQYSAERNIVFFYGKKTQTWLEVNKLLNIFFGGGRGGRASHGTIQLCNHYFFSVEN